MAETITGRLRFVLRHRPTDWDQGGNSALVSTRQKVRILQQEFRDTGTGASVWRDVPTEPTTGEPQ